MIRIGGMWVGKDKNDQTMITGKVDNAVPTIGGMRLLLFKNKDKQGKQPDFFVHLANVEEQAEVQKDMDTNLDF